MKCNIQLEKESSTYYKSIVLINKLLQNYQGNDKKFLITELNKLHEKIETIRKIIKNHFSLSNKNKIKVSNFHKEHLQNLKKEFNDFIIILRHCNFGELKNKLHIIINEHNMLHFL